MSHFNLILVTMLGFWFSPLLIGMDQQPEDNKLSSNYYLSQDIKKLMLFRQKANLKDFDGKQVPKEVKDIIVNNAYMLYRDQLLKNANGTTKYNTFIHKYADNFDFVSMNTEGRNCFYGLMNYYFFTTPKECDGFVKLPTKLKLIANLSSIKTKKDSSFLLDDWKVNVGTITGVMLGLNAILKDISWSDLWSSLSSLTSEDLNLALLVGPFIISIPIATGCIGYFVGDFLTDKPSNFGYVERKMFTQKEQAVIAAKKEIKKKNLEIKSNKKTMESLVQTRREELRQIAQYKKDPKGFMKKYKSLSLS
jgi:hypothetical protein